MGSISSASNVTTLSSHNVEEKDAIIESLQRELGMLKEQVEEFNDLRMSVIKVTGKNGVRKLKDKYLTTSDKVNANEISYFLRNSIWPHVKLMPEKWHKWNRFTKEDYWMGVVRSLANDKLCAMRSNMKQGLFNQFKGMIVFVYI